jgi:hypothetical protein
MIGQPWKEDKAMSGRDDFLEWVRTRLYEAEVARHNGDIAPRLAIWSTTEPVTVHGALKSTTSYPETKEASHGWSRRSPTARRIRSNWSPLTC